MCEEAIPLASLLSPGSQVQCGISGVGRIQVTGDPRVPCSVPGFSSGTGGKPVVQAAIGIHQGRWPFLQEYMRRGEPAPSDHESQ